MLVLFHGTGIINPTKMKMNKHIGQNVFLPCLLVLAIQTLNARGIELQLLSLVHKALTFFSNLLSFHSQRRGLIGPPWAAPQASSFPKPSHVCTRGAHR